MASVGYAALDILYDGSRIWYHNHNVAGGGNDLIGHHEVGPGAWYDDAYTYGVHFPGTVQSRLGFDGFNLWYYSPSTANDAQLSLAKLPVAGASKLLAAPVSLATFVATLEKWEVSRGIWTPPANYQFGRMFFDGFTLWLGPIAFGGTWGVRVPWAVVR